MSDASQPAHDSMDDIALRDADRDTVDRLLRHVVAQRTQQNGQTQPHVDPGELLAAARAALDSEIAPVAAPAYAAYLRAQDAERAAPTPPRAARSGVSMTAPLLIAGTGGVTAFAADLAHGLAGGAALATGVAVAAVVGVAGGAREMSRGRNSARGDQDAAQARRRWLSDLERRGVRPFLARVAAETPQTADVPPTPEAAAPVSAPPAPYRRPDRSAAARQRTLLEQSFAALPETVGPYPGRRGHLASISQWVQHARASTETKPTVVVLHGSAGSGRSTLAVRAARELSGQFRGACVVALRGDASGEEPLTTREALLHLLNRFGAPREQLLFREMPSRDQHLERLSELYHKHLAGLPVIIVLDDAADPEQVRALVPAHSESLVLVTAAAPLALDLPDAWVRELPVAALDEADSLTLLRELADGPLTPRDTEPARRVRELCGGLPLALRAAASALDARTMDVLAAELAAGGPPDPVERVLSLRYRDQPESGRRLLRRLALAGRASLGAGAAASLLAADESEAARLLGELARAGLVEHVRGRRYRLHDLVRDFALARLLEEEPEAERTAARERLIRTYSELADSVIRLVDGRTSTRADAFVHGAVGAHGFRSLDQALRWLDEESSFITATVRGAQGVDTAAVLHLLGALCDYCLLRGDLYRLGEISELTQEVDQGLLTRSVRWRTGIAARQLGELDRARSTLTSVVDLYVAAEQPAGAARARASLGITMHHQGDLADAADKLREALETQRADDLRGDQGWTLHALAAVVRDQGDVREALTLLERALELHRESESVRGQAWSHLQLGQTLLSTGETRRAEAELHQAQSEYALTGDTRGAAWTLTQLARVRLQRGEGAVAVADLNDALTRHRENEDARGEAWTLYHLGEALEESGDIGAALKSLERARTMFSRMSDALGLAGARHHLGRLTRDDRARQAGNLRNSGFARQLLQDARADYRKLGVPHGQGWACLELAVIDAGNERLPEALALTEEAVGLFAGLGDRRGEDWARFLRCTLLPLVSEAGARVARDDLAALLAADHEDRDPAVTEYAAAWAVVLRRGLAPGAGWDVWRLGMTPSRGSQDRMSAPAGDA